MRHMWATGGIAVGVSPFVPCCDPPFRDQQGPLTVGFLTFCQLPNDFIPPATMSLDNSSGLAAKGASCIMHGTFFTRVTSRPRFVSPSKVPFQVMLCRYFLLCAAAHVRHVRSRRK